MQTADLEMRVQELLHRGDTGLHDIARMIDRADLYTYGHSERVAKYAVALGRFMDLDGETLECLRCAGLLHDLGKILLPAVILQKPARLDEGESRLLAAHPRKGAEILARHPAYERIAEVVRHHHERIDGRGYPDGLDGDDIPLEARVVSVVDSYDAMVSTRPYRRSMSIEDALSQLRRGAGSQFDAMFVASFVQMIRDRRALRAARLGASTLYVEISLREYETAVRYYARKQPAATPMNLADLLCMEYPEVAREDALKIAMNVLDRDTMVDDLYSEDVAWEKENEPCVRFPARIDADVGSVVRFDGELYSVLNVIETEDGRLEYRLKR